MKWAVYFNYKGLTIEAEVSAEDRYTALRELEVKYPSMQIIKVIEIEWRIIVCKLNQIRGAKLCVQNL